MNWVLTIKNAESREAIVEAHLERYGLHIGQQDAPEIRRVLRNEIGVESLRQGAGDTEMMRLCCTQLFSLGQEEDIRLIWQAKTSSMDADGAIDIQLLCGRGLEETIRFLSTQPDNVSRQAIQRIHEYREHGFFEGFTPASWLQSLDDYYSDCE